MTERQRIDYDYEERWVAFIDILGFKEHVKQLDDEAKRFDLLEAVRRLNSGSGYYLYRAETLGFTENLRATTFSDNIVISGSAYELQYVVEMAGLLCRELLSQGYMARGAIAKGQLCHSSDLVVGVGLVEAYKLENEVASYPRVIIQDSCLDEVIRESTTFPIVEDFDGMHYLDYAGGHALFSAVQPSKVLEQVDLAFRSNDQKVKAKAHWMKRYLDRHSLS